MKTFFTTLLLFCFICTSWAQSNSSYTPRVCGSVYDIQSIQKTDLQKYYRAVEIEKRTQEFLEQNGYSSVKRKQQNANTSNRVTDPQVTITIPVVVHVLFNSAAQNISTAQIQTQLDVLNEDFRRRNPDASQTPSVFQNVATDTNIEFKLACIDPNGNTTTGIVPVSTSRSGFSVQYFPGTRQIDEAATGIKYVAGAGAWPSDRYLNIWTCNFTDTTLGYATFPGQSTSATDGVVVAFDAFGRGVAGLKTNFDKGRTATHEIGHWLNLIHIWGNANCGNDFCSDTPTQQQANYGCVSFPHPTCSNSGDMSMNYMDYSDDRCMNLFTNEQKGRARALFAAGMPRESFISAKIQQQATQVCGNTTFSVAQNQGAAVNYQWTVSGALSLASGQGTNQITTTQNGTGPAIIQVSANGYCESKTVQVGPYIASGKYTSDYQEQPLVASTYALDPNFVNDSYVQISLDDIPGTTNTFTLGSGQPHSLYTTSNATATLYYNHSVNYADVYVTNTGGPCGPVTTWFSFYYPTYYSYAYSPNPATDELTVQAQPQQANGSERRSIAIVPAKTFLVELYNSQGLRVASKASKEGKVIVDVRNLPDGLYNLRIGQGKDAKTEHIQITH